MNTIDPPVTVGDKSNQVKVDYIQENASKVDFAYPPVRVILFTLPSLFYTPTSVF